MVDDLDLRVEDKDTHRIRSFSEVVPFELVKAQPDRVTYVGADLHHQQPEVLSFMTLMCLCLAESNNYYPYDKPMTRRSATLGKGLKLFRYSIRSILRKKCPYVLPRQSYPLTTGR